jgi:hypothetical protein
LATFLAAIFIGFPVCGFLPLRAFRLARENDSKPGNINLSPFYKTLLIPSVTPLTARPAAAFVILHPYFCYKFFFCHTNTLPLDLVVKIIYSYSSLNIVPIKESKALY